MLDINTYRAYEGLAKAQLPTWRIAQAHTVSHFESIGFPVRVIGIAELGQLLDTMQENRFNHIMNDLGGLTEAEYNFLTTACYKSVQFQLSFFPNRRPVLPLSTLMSVFSLYVKMINIEPHFESVLEIGPGCGYLSYLLRRHLFLENYSQVEACESFYLLQNLVNTYCFGRYFSEKVFPQEQIQFLTIPHDNIEPVHLVEVPTKKKCYHYPWWRIGELLRQEFQIITSNANLLEMNPEALEDYIYIMSKVLHDNGIIIVQCTGHEKYGSPDSLVPKFAKENLVVSTMTRISGAMNMLIVKPTNQIPNLADKVFSRHSDDRRIYLFNQFVDDTERLFNGYHVT